MTTAPVNDLNSRFQNELQAVNEDVRRKAALAAFHKLRPSNRVTVEQFLGGLHTHKEMWVVVGSLGIVEFAEALAGHHVPAPSETRRRRTRINDGQKSSLKAAILRMLEGHAAGMNRIEVTAAIIAGGLAPQGIERAALPEKVRQPLHELVAEGKLHTVGEKRLMKYVMGPSGKTAK